MKATRNRALLGTWMLVASFLTGCGHLPGESLRPSAPPAAVKSVKVLIVEGRQADEDGPITLDEAKRAVGTLRNAIVAAAERKNAQWWDSGLTTLIGGSMATVGSVASRTGLMNTGFLLAFLGLTGDQFYKPSATIEVHLDSDAKLLCVEDELFAVTESDRLLAVSGAEAPGSDEAAKAVESTLQAVGSAMLTYRRSLLGIRPGTPSRAELLDFLKRYQAGQDTKANQPESKGSEEEARRTAAAAKFIGLSAALQACVKVGVPPSK